MRPWPVWDGWSARPRLLRVVQSSWFPQVVCLSLDSLSQRGFSVLDSMSCLSMPFFNSTEWGDVLVVVKICLLFWKRLCILVLNLATMLVQRRIFCSVFKQGFKETLPRHFHEWRQAVSQVSRGTKLQWNGMFSKNDRTWGFFFSFYWQRFRLSTDWCHHVSKIFLSSVSTNVPFQMFCFALRHHLFYLLAFLL